MNASSVSIGEIAAINPRLDKGDRPDPRSPVSFVSMAGVSEKTVSIVEANDRPYEEVAKGYTVFRRGDLLVAKITPCFENGKMALAENLPRELGFGSTEFHVIRPSEKVYPRYLFNLLRDPYVRRAGEMKMKGAAGQRRVPAEFFAGLKIPLPPLNEQKRIAKILDAADALRAKRRESLAELDALLQSTFLDLFGDRDSWSAVTFESVAEDGRGTFSNGPFGSDLLTSELQESGVPVIYIRDIRDGVYCRVSGSHVTDEKAAELSACQVRPKDVLIAKVGDPPGTAAVYPDNEPLGIVTQDVIRIRVDEEIADPLFIAGYLNSDYGKRKLAEITVEATRARFGLRDLKKLTFPLPPKGVQESYSKVAVKIAMQKNALANHSAELDSLFSSLQQKAFSGEL